MSEFNLGDIVFLRVREERKPGMITAVTTRPNGIMYGVTFEDGERWHFGIELSKTWVPVLSEDTEKARKD